MNLEEGFRGQYLLVLPLSLSLLPLLLLGEGDLDRRGGGDSGGILHGPSQVG